MPHNNKETLFQASAALNKGITGSSGDNSILVYSNIAILTLPRPIEIYIKFDTVKIGWSIVYIKGVKDYNFQIILDFFLCRLICLSKQCRYR